MFNVTITKKTRFFALRYVAYAFGVTALLSWLLASLTKYPEDVWLFFAQMWGSVIAMGLLMGVVFGLMIRFNQRNKQF